MTFSSAILATVASYALGWLIGLPVLVPFLNAAVPWWLMTSELRGGRTSRAIAVMLVWAATMGVVSTTTAWLRPAEARALFLRSDYRDEMHAWVRTGIGAETTPSIFLPRHIAYAGAFAGTSILTGGMLAMPMGAVLMNSMGDYVGSMAGSSARPIASAVLGWHPWAVLRVCGFVILGVVLSGVVLSRVLGFPFSLVRERRWLVIGASLLALDVALKLGLGPMWGRLLRDVAGW
jgi:hypothetical protein